MGQQLAKLLGHAEAMVRKRLRAKGLNIFSRLARD
jgi:biotin operon repressor